MGEIKGLLPKQTSIIKTFNNWIIACQKWVEINDVNNSLSYETPKLGSGPLNLFFSLGGIIAFLGRFGRCLEVPFARRFNICTYYNHWSFQPLLLKI